MRRTVQSASVMAIVLAASPARGGGMTLPFRGARTLERAGAYVAGAEDADALWQDPAGLARRAGDGRRSLLFDAAFVYQTVDYTPVGDATVSNQQPGQPIPTLAGALGVGDQLVIAGGIAAPYSGSERYPADGAQRYASLGMTGATYVIVTVGVGYRVNDQLRVGATLQDQFTKLTLATVTSGCPGAMTCAPDDRSFDMLVTVDQTDAIAPSGSVGVQYDATPAVTLGAMAQAPTRVSGDATITLGLPSSTVFDNAMVTGDRGALAFTLPPIVRAGVEVRPVPELRVEAALGAELWAVHDEIAIVPDAIVVHAGGSDFPLARMTIARDYKTSLSPAVGVEWHGPKLQLGAGYAYETAAAPPGTVSVLTVDSAKHVLGVGGGYEDAGWQIGAAAGIALLADVDVAAADAKVDQLQPLAATPQQVPVNAGHYASRYLIAGLRFARSW